MTKWRKLRDEDMAGWQCTFCGFITKCEPGRVKAQTDYKQPCRNCGKTRSETNAAISRRS